ncbi:uncharacterized protein RJT20DRAFT_48533 [Scheffersomyces xylosifermentans]|uniref:uncharacterized protein n=1 Tax=Scheffersomyces xylosifermentans TaxID=1304137 RepID=UPI00315D4B94
MRFANIFVLVQIALILVKAEEFSIKDFRSIDRKALDTTNVIEVSEINEDSDLSLFEDIETVIRCTSTGTIVVNKQKLNSAERTGGNMFAFLPENKQDKHTWIEFRQSGTETVLGPRVPLSACLSNRFGDGGSLAGTFSTTFGKTLTLDFPLGYEFGSRFSAFIDWSPEVKSSLTISATYSCDVPKGKRGQMFLQPYFVEVGNPETRTIIIKKGRSIKNPFKKKPQHLSIGDWEHYGKSIRLNSPFLKPIFTCVTEDELLMCNGNVLGPIFNNY